MRFALFLLLACVVGGCKSKHDDLPPATQCDEKDSCGSGVIGGAGTGTGGSGGGTSTSTSTSTSTASGTVGDVTGRVTVVTGTMLDFGSLYTGEATVEAVQMGGSPTTAFYDPAIPGYDLKNVVAGESWIFVTDLLAPAQPVLPTFNPVYLIPGSTANLDLAVLDRENLATIAASIGAALSENYAQIVLQVNRGGAPLKDVSVFGDVGGAKIGYDIDGLPGQYSGTSSATGGTGFILLINASAPPTGQLMVSLIDLDQNKFTIPVRVDQGSAALLPIDLQ